MQNYIMSSQHQQQILKTINKQLINSHQQQHKLIAIQKSQISKQKKINQINKQINQLNKKTLMTQPLISIKTMLQKGQDPKQFLIEICRPQCKLKFQKLQRCQDTLRQMKNLDPELSCMYPLRDWVTCIDGCVQPKIHKELVGNQSGRLFH